MAVYKRAYRAYEGRLTSERWRFLVLPRYAFSEIFTSRLLTAFLVLCFVPFLFESIVIYVSNSPAARELLRIPAPDAGDTMGPQFFLATFTFQGALAFLLTAWVAPILVSPDLVNGALPLYLSRPFSRAEYVLGKAAVLVALLSCITWIPHLALFTLQASLADASWMGANLGIVRGILLGGWIWILVLTLLGLAISAWVRWRLVASGALIGVFFMGAAFGEMWREVLRDPWGRLANLSYLIAIVWTDLFGIVSRSSLARQMLDDDRRSRDLPVWAAWMGLAFVCTLCLWLLNRRLQAREVVS